MPNPIYKSHAAPRIILANGNDATKRGEVGIDYNDEKCIEYTKFGHQRFFDGYAVEVPKDPKFITGTTVNINVKNTKPIGTTTPVNHSFTVKPNEDWQFSFLLWAPMRFDLGAGPLQFSFVATTPPTPTNKGGTIYVSFITTTTAIAP